MLSLLMAAVVGRVAGKRAALGIGLWLVITAVLSATGQLAYFGNPPRLLPILVISFAGVVWLSRSPALNELPLALLIGTQSFRIPVELLIHQAVVEGIAPPQMTWPPMGLNLDVLTGVTALLIAPLAKRLSRPVILVWNTAGLALLAWVVGVALVSMPTPFQRLEPDNIWVAWWPFVWLPVALVGSALLGHLLVFRRLKADRAA